MHDVWPLTPEPVQARGTICAFDGAEPKGTLTAVTVNGSTAVFWADRHRRLE